MQSILSISPLKRRLNPLTHSQISDIVCVSIKKDVRNMSEVEVRKDESFESALRRFKKKIDREGILRELKERKHYEKPSEKRRKKMRSRKAKK